MANLNTPVRRFESNGVLEIGADVVKNMNSGSLSWTFPIRQRLEYADRGEQQVPIEGDGQLCEIRFTVKAGVHVTNGIVNALTVASNTNAAKTFAIDVTIPTLHGAAVGESYAWAAAWLAEPPQLQTGADFDTISFVLKSTTGPTVATIS